VSHFVIVTLSTMVQGLMTREATVSQVNGTFTIQIPASNDPAWSPANQTYEITVEGDNLHYQFDAQIPYGSSPLDFSDILPALTPSEGVLYAAFGHTHAGGGGGVTSVNARTGAVVLAATDVALGSVDNTSDAAKPVSTAQQTALNLKANLASPTFTGTVSGVTAAMVGLPNVNNTADSAKPVSTAQQTALNLKADLASPALTGTPTAPTAAVGTNTTQVATTAFVQAKTPVETVYTTPGSFSYADPGATCKYLDVTVISAGGGGGSGRRGAATSVRNGGGGGAGGGYSRLQIPYASVSFPVTVALGAAGTGGTAISANDTNGNAGGSSTGSSFGPYVRTASAGGGPAGTATTQTAAFSGAGMTFGQTGVTSSATGALPGNPSSFPSGPTSGGAGGGITSGDAASNGGAGGAGMNNIAATAGVVGGASPAAGTAQPTNSAVPGSGGGGGAASITTAAQAGAAGGLYGSGGGGGGASLNGNNSGAGGDGAGGIIRVIAYF